MPINETTGRSRRTGLTRQQVRDATLAVYGYARDPLLVGMEVRNNPMPEQQQYTESEIQIMRRILAQHDQSQKPLKEFDLNRPPLVPYSHKEYPRLMSNHATRRHKEAANKAEMDAMIADGWQKDDFPAEPEDNDVELTPEEQAEVAALDAKLRAKKKKKKAA